MREIKFRGKRIDNGEWVFGDLTRYSEEMSYITVDLLENELHQVYTETVGQYTGLKDKNDTEIYEGDVLKTYSGIGVVSYKEPSFVVSGEYQEVFANCYDEFEIIGNIHENPELLK